MKKKTRLRIAILLLTSLVLVACARNASNAPTPPPPAPWLDLGVISIPSTWSFYEADPGYGPFSMDIFGEGVGGSIRMAVWGVTVGDPDLIVNEFASQQAFTFDSGHSGYMLQEHSFESDTLVLWLIPDSWMALSLYDDGNASVFTDNEKLILKIAKTLTDHVDVP